jgi:Leucine-rich repeat (LRR) protein
MKPIITIILSFFALSIWADENIGIGDNTDTNITIDETNFPDEDFRNWVLSQSYGKDGILTDEEIATVTRIEISPWDIVVKSLQGIEFFTALTDLECSSLQLISLDLSKNTALVNLFCEDNQLTSLNLSGCKALKYLECYNNQLTSLNLSGCSSLENLVCYNNQLTSLNVSGCSVLAGIDCYMNKIKGAEMDKFVESLPNTNDGVLRVICDDSMRYDEDDSNVMTTLQVAAAKAKGWIPCYYYYNWWREYAGSEPTLVEEGIAIDETNFPDENFRKWVLSQDYGKDSVLTDKEIAAIDNISVSNQNISNLQGIAYFTSLLTLWCSGNQLTTIDVSALKSLKELECGFNQLTSLDVSQNTALEDLGCPNNQLSELDVSKNPELVWLNCSNNQLSVLDVSYNTKLDLLRCSSNLLTSLDVSKNTVLTLLSCATNQLTTLDLSNNTRLYELICYQNQIKDAGMDAFVKHLPKVNSGLIDAIVETDEQNVMTTKQVKAANAKGWTVRYSKIVSEYGNTWIVYTGSDTDPDEGGGEVVTPEIAYRPFVEEGKVWKVGYRPEVPVQMVEYYYFDGDTIFNGKNCKWMWCQQYANEMSTWYDLCYRVQQPLYRVGIWYEEDKKVYFRSASNNQMTSGSLYLLYDFSVNPGDTLAYLVVTAKGYGESPYFKGTYYDLVEYANESHWQNRWMVGVGRADIPTYNLYRGEDRPFTYLMSCTVGDEVIYLNDQVADGATPGISEAKKRRFDFNHTIKTQPKAPGNRSEELGDVYGEYNDQQLNIGLGSLDEVYMVRITDNAGQAVYEKTINAGNIVALNIGISAYPEGQYTVTIENSKEAFTGVFDTTATGIEEHASPQPSPQGKGAIFNLQGQRISVSSESSAPSVLPKGVYIVGGKKLFVK